MIGQRLAAQSFPLSGRDNAFNPFFARSQHTACHVFLPSFSHVEIQNPHPFSDTLRTVVQMGRFSSSRSALASNGIYLLYLLYIIRCLLKVHSIIAWYVIWCFIFVIIAICFCSFPSRARARFSSGPEPSATALLVESRPLLLLHQIGGSQTVENVCE